jgi:cysteine desulfurase / selenocysteine lyase
MIYLDNAATSFPKPESVYRKVDEILRIISGNPGRASHRMALEASRVIFNSRELVSRLINAPDSSRVAFTKNATEAINIALKGLLRKGDHVVTTTFEHNCVVKTLARLEGEGIYISKVRPDKDGFLDVRDIVGAMRKDTKIVCVAHASNVFGAIQDVATIGKAVREKGALFLVDGAQTVGAVPVDVEGMNIDLLAATGHKALFGLQGTGFLYARAGVEPYPLVDGGTGEITSVLEMPDRLEAGTMNTPGIGGLGAGVEYVLNEGVEKIRAYEEGLIEEILKGLKAIDGVSMIGPLDARRRAGLVAFNIKGMVSAPVGTRLDDEFSIMVRCNTHCAPEAHREAGTFPEGAVRVSPGYFTKPAEIEEFLRAVRTIAGK